MRSLFVLVLCTEACATSIKAKSPLSSAQAQDFTNTVGGYEVEVKADEKASRPLTLRLHDVEFTTESVRGTAADGPQVVPLVDVASVQWTSRWRSGLLGLLIGPPVGAVVGAAIGSALPHSCGPGCTSSETQAINAMAGFAVGALAGIVIGPIVGALAAPASHIDFGPPKATVPRESEPDRDAR